MILSQSRRGMLHELLVQWLAAEESLQDTPGPGNIIAAVHLKYLKNINYTSEDRFAMTLVALMI